LLYDKDICEQLFQLGGTIDGIPTYDLIEAYKPQTLDDLAIFLALLRPRKKHLIGREWDEIKAEIWQAGDDSLYGFKRAHALSYALVIVVQLNLLVEKANGSEPTV
jgi:DNA polymerase III alpha subunit